MKKYIFFITSLFIFLTGTISCTNTEKFSEETKPGTYIIEKSLHAIKDENNSRGINNSNSDFDLVYNPDSICLHIVGSENYVSMPLYPGNCNTSQECKCFRYRIDVYKDGHAEVTPILDEQGTLSDKKLRIEAEENCYFSSVGYSIWELDQTQIYSKSNHVLYEMDPSTNDEIYRSEENYSIAKLTNSVDGLLMGRACAAFTVLGLFYDAEELNSNPDPEEDVEVTIEEFKTIMGSDPSKWYIKIYVGGDPFVHKYNLGTMTLENSNYNHGYYSTGTFAEGFKNNTFLQFKRKKHGIGQYTLRCYGYYTAIDTRLFTPALNTTEALDVYILIKHWEGEGEPSLEWLTDDSDALYTRMNITGEIYPYNNCFYTLGLLMDIRQFKKAWDEKQSSRLSTQSRTANGMHYFELKDAKVIVEKH